MPKRNAAYFAELLYELLDGASKDDVPKLIRHFLLWMERQGAPALFPKLISAYEETARLAQGIIKVEVRVAREIPELIKHLKQLVKDKEIVLETKIDPEIIGGATIQIDDTFIDASLRGRIKELKKAMIYGLN